MDLVIEVRNYWFYFVGLNVYKLIVSMKLKFHNNRYSLIITLWRDPTGSTVITIKETTHPDSILNFILAFYFYGS